MDAADGLSPKAKGIIATPSNDFKNVKTVAGQEGDDSGGHVRKELQFCYVGSWHPAKSSYTLED